MLGVLMCLRVSLLLAFVAGSSSWTTLVPLPVTGDASFCSQTYNNALFVVNAQHAHKLDVSPGVLSAVWTTLAASPHVTEMYRSSVVTSTGVMVLVGNPHVDRLDLSAEAWTSGADVPSPRWGSASSLIGNLMWVVGGVKAPVIKDTNEEYNVALGSWVTRTAIPTARAGSSMGCDGVGACFVFGGSLSEPGSSFTDAVERYTPSDDAWTTRQRAPHAFASFDTALVEPNVYYVWSEAKFDIYLSPTDEWTSLSTYLPLTFNRYRLGAALLPSGIFCLGETPPPSASAIYFLAGAHASMVGDPIVTAFDGQTHHFDLYPGVFNLLTTRTTLVSAVVEMVPSLPPDENHVMSVVAVAGKIDGTVFWLDCSIQYSEHTAFSCTKGSSAPLDVFSFEENSMAIALPEFTITISLSRCAVALPPTTIGDRLLYPAWLDVRVHSRCLLPPPCLGLLCYNASRPVQDYEVGSGSLFETNPHQMAVASAGLFAVSLP